MAGQGQEGAGQAVSTCPICLSPGLTLKSLHGQEGQASYMTPLPHTNVVLPYVIHDEKVMLACPVSVFSLGLQGIALLSVSQSLVGRQENPQGHAVPGTRFSTA